jgi:hypothetical protein
VNQRVVKAVVRSQDDGGHERLASKSVERNPGFSVDGLNQDTLCEQPLSLRRLRPLTT